MSMDDDGTVYMSAVKEQPSANRVLSCGSGRSDWPYSNHAAQQSASGRRRVSIACLVVARVTLVWATGADSVLVLVS